jgi:hypothetical protein
MACTLIKLFKGSCYQRVSATFSNYYIDGNIFSLGSPVYSASTCTPTNYAETGWYVYRQDSTTSFAFYINNGFVSTTPTQCPCSKGYVNTPNTFYSYVNCCGEFIQGVTSSSVPLVIDDIDSNYATNGIQVFDTLNPRESCTPTQTPTQTPTNNPTSTSTPTPTITPTQTKTPTPTPSRSGLPAPVDFQVFNECDVFTNYPLVLSCRVITPASYLNDDGEIKINIAGGTPPYQIFWSNGSRQDTISKLSAGDYSVQVIDYYGDYTATTTCTLPAVLPPCEIEGTATYLQPSTIYAVVLNDSDEIGNKINNLSYSSVTNPTIGFNFNNTNVALASTPIGYSAKTNISSYIPNYNDTVRMQIPEIPVSPADLEFDPTFDCKMWYYTGNVEYTASQFINSAIPNLIPLTISNTNINSISNYTAQFPFNYIGSPSFYYLVWDFRNYPDLFQFKVFANSLTTFTATTLTSILNSQAKRFWVDFGNGNSQYFSGGTYTGGTFTTGYTSPFTGEIIFKSENLSAFTEINFSETTVTSNPSTISGLTFTTSELGKLSGLTTLVLGVPTDVDGVLNTSKPHLSGTPSELPRNIVTMYASNTSLFGNISGFPSTITNLRIGTNNLSGSTNQFPSGILNLLQILGNNSIAGNTLGLPRKSQTIDISGNNTISGDTSGLPTGTTYLHIFGNNTISGTTLGLPRTINDDLAITGLNTITGDVADLPTGTTRLSITGLNSITGNTIDLPRNLISLNLSCSGGNANLCSNALYGDVADLPSGLTLFRHVSTGTTLSGDTSNIPTGMTAFIVTDGNNMTIGGNLSNLPNNLYTIIIKGNNQINSYTGKIWPNPMNHLDISGGYTGLTSGDTNTLLQDLSATSWVGRSLSDGGFFAPYIGIKCVVSYIPQGAALTAYNSLTGQGVNVQITS